MPATAIAKQTAPSLYSQTGLVLTQTAVDVANGNNVAVGVGDSILLLVRNTGGSARDFDITSVADPTFGRTGHVDVSIAAGELRAFRLTKQGWADGSSNINFQGAHADLVISILKL